MSDCYSRVYTQLNFSAPVYSTPRMSGMPVPTVYKNRLNQYQVPIQYPNQPVTLYRNAFFFEIFLCNKCDQTVCIIVPSSPPNPK
jgi:hypothetical protein